MCHAELYEETGQIVSNLTFIGLLKVENILNGKIKHNPVYFSEIKTLTPFKINKETTSIKLLDLIESIGYIDELDLTLLKHIKFLF